MTHRPKIQDFLNHIRDYTPFLADISTLDEPLGVAGDISVRRHWLIAICVPVEHDRPCITLAQSNTLNGLVNQWYSRRDPPTCTLCSHSTVRYFGPSDWQRADTWHKLDHVHHFQFVKEFFPALYAKVSAQFAPAASQGSRNAMHIEIMCVHECSGDVDDRRRQQGAH